MAFELDGTEWRITHVGDTALVEGRPPTVRFDDGAIGGLATVNRYRGSYRLDGDVLTVGPVMSTRMAGPPEAMEQEDRWLAALREPSTLRMDGDVLVMTHADGAESRLVRIGATVTVNGTVGYRARIAMLPGSVMTVTLEDTSRADTPAVRIAEQIIDDPGQVPVPFVLEVDPAAVPATARLALRARIEVDGELRWTTDTHHAVDLDAEPQPHDLVLRQVGG